jgi:hypothetical protein
MDSAQWSVYSQNFGAYRMLRVFTTMKRIRYDACSLRHGEVIRIHVSYSGGPEFKYQPRLLYILTDMFGFYTVRPSDSWVIIYV